MAHSILSDLRPGLSHPAAPATWFQPLVRLGPDGAVALAILLLALDPLYPILWEMDNGSLITETYWYLTGGLLGFLLWKESGGAGLRWLRRQLPLVLLILAWAMFSTLWSVEPQISAHVTGFMIATTIVGFYIGYHFDPRTLMALLFWFFAICITGSIIAAVLFPDYGVSGQNWTGLTPHKNDLGPIAAASALLFFIAAIYERLNRWLALALLGASLATLIASACATAMVQIILGMIFVSSFSIAKLLRFPSLAVLLILSILAFAGVALVLSNLDAATALLDRDSTLTNRTEIWSDALAIIAERPLTGFGFEVVWARWHGWLPGFPATNQASHAHNGFLQLATGLGVPAALLAVVLVIRTWWVSFAVFVQTRSAFALFCATYILLFLVLNVTESRLFQFGRVDWVLFVALAVAMLRSLNGPPRHGARPDPHSGR